MAYTQLFRIDDISWDMNYENFSRIRNLFFQYDIRPIIGVIPHNEDPKLKEQAGGNGIPQDRFWEEMRTLQQEHGWAIALHGYDHVYVTSDGGIFKTNPRAEFAGLPYGRQEEKIRKGKAILEENGLRIDAFMAPGYSLDWNTVEALKVNGITVVTDGLAAYPYRKRGVLFVPQVLPWPRIEACGVATFDWGGYATDPALESINAFKRGFGGEIQPRTYAMITSKRWVRFAYLVLEHTRKAKK